MIEDGAEVYDSVIMEDVVISKGAKVYTAIVDSDVTVAKKCRVGMPGADKSGITVIAKGTAVLADIPEKV